MTRRLTSGLRARIVVVSLLAFCGAAQAVAGQDNALINQARRLDLAGQQDAAIAIYRQALEREPESFDAHYGLARALDLTGRYDEARQHFAKAIERAPESGKEQAIRMMGIAWTFVGDAAQAAGAFREVFDRRMAAKNYPGAAEEGDEIGRVYLETGGLEQAAMWYRTAHETAGRESGRPQWQVDLADMRWAHAQARIAARRGQAPEARRQTALVKALLDKGGNKDQLNQYPYLLGYVNLYLKDYRGAVEAFKTADQSDPFVLLLLADATEKLGDRKGAGEYYQKILQSSAHSVNNAFARPVALRKLGTAVKAPATPAAK